MLLADYPESNWTAALRLLGLERESYEGRKGRVE